MKQIRPRFSIIVASYNYERYITMTLDSLLSQTNQDFEIIVVDDGSTDNSREVIRRYTERDPRISLHTHPGNANHGLVTTIKLGISKCSGLYIAFCESDDMWTHDHLERIAEALYRHPDAHIISNGVLTFGNPERVKWMRKYFMRIKKHLRDGMNMVDVRRWISMNWVPTFSCVMFEADTLRGLNLDAPIPKWTDIWMYQQLLCHEPLLHITHPLTLWRIHGNSQNTNNADPNEHLFYERLRQMMDTINGSPRNDLYLRHHRLRYWWYRLKGLV